MTTTFCKPNATRRTVLDLGCGLRKRPGAIGIDRIALAGVNMVADLDRYPLPIANDVADEVVLSHVLEHVRDVIATMEEIWRICKPGGLVTIRTPHYSGRYAWLDITHKRAFCADSFTYFGRSSYSYYTKARFEIVRQRLVYFMEKPYRSVFSLIAKPVQALLDRHPTFAERFLCYLIGGIDEVQVTLRAVKGVQTNTGSAIYRRSG